MMNCDIKYMRRAIQLALNGQIFASPNPMVGAVIVHNDTIIGEGYHRRCGEGHAEVNAIASVANPELLTQSTIYVTLEPCSHYGKTPPCAQLIIDKKIPRVVIGCLDPFEKVCGRGVKMLQDAGINVTHGILDEECKALNSIFITAHSLHRPFIMLKWAQSNDGYIDHIRSATTPMAAKFSTTLTSTLVHKIRAKYDAIMVGSNTIIADNPQLNCRLWDGNNPTRVVIDRKGKVPSSAKIFIYNPNNTIYITAKQREDIPSSVTQIIVNYDTSLSDIMTILYNHNITSLIVEGGSSLLQKAIDENLWDIIRVETSNFALGSNGTIKAPKITTIANNSYIIDKNKIALYYNHS